MNRRLFLQTGLFVAGNNLIPSNLPFKKRKNVLIIGGTSFLGPAIVKACLKENHSVTLTNRGITNPQLFSQLELIKADRLGGLENNKQLQKKTWDVVIDVWPQDPRLVEESARFFQHKTNHYIFISSIAAYHDYKVMNITETYSTKEGEEFVEGHYGTNKAICERIIQTYFPINYTVIRPGSIVGDRDPSYGFRYWTWKIKRGGSILAPSGMNETIQFVDVTDVAKWVQKCIQNNHYGFYNLVGPERKTTFHSFLLDCQKELNADATFIFVSNEFIKANNINTRQSLPLWNSFDSDFPGFENLSNEKVKALGMKFKSVQDSIRDSFNDYSSAYKFGDRENYAGLSESEESALIQKWQTENTQKK